MTSTFAQISIGAIAGIIAGVGIVGMSMIGYPFFKTRFFGERTVDENFTTYKSNALGAECIIKVKN